MQTYHNTAQETNGDIITTASVYVYLAGTGTLASLKLADETTAINNPFTVSDPNYDTDGSFWFKAVNDIYDVKIVNGGDESWKRGIVLYDFNDGALGDVVGIGVTPETWFSNAAVLQVGHQGALYADKDVSNNFVALSTNVYLESGASDDWYIHTDTATQYKQQYGTHLFQTALSGTEDTSITWEDALFIDNLAAVGIRAVPEAWHSTYVAAQIGLGGSIQGRTNSSRVYVSSNAYANTSGVSSYINSDYASNITQINGAITLQVAASGTADAAITWVDALSIDNSANAAFGGDVTLSSGQLQIVRPSAGSQYLDVLLAAGGTYFNVSAGSGALNFSTNGGTTDMLTIDGSGNSSFSGNVSIADGKYYYAGTDDDLELRHDGTNGRIYNNTGSLIFRSQVTSGTFDFWTYDSSDSLKQVLNLGGPTPYVRLYYDGNERLATDSTGVTLAVGGTVPRLTFDSGDYVQHYKASNELTFRLADLTKLIIKTNTINMNVPTSSAGLSSGDIWSNSGVLTIV